MTLADLVEGVLDRNPSVEAARARWKAAIERHPQALTLPDPMVRFQYWTRSSMNPAAPQRLDTMVTQAIPFPASIALKGDLALREAEMERLRYDMALRDAIVEVREAFLELAYLDRAREVLEEQEGILARYATVAAGDLEIGRTNLPEEFRARSLLAQAGYDRTLVLDLRRVEEQRVRGLLRLPTACPLGPAEAPDRRIVAIPFEEVLALAESRSQDLAMAGVALQMAGIEKSMARWEYAPEFEVGGVWMKNMEDVSGEFMGGRAATLGFTVPIWVHAKSARVREAESLEVAAGAERTAAAERIRTAAARLYFRVVNGQRLATLYRDTLLPQAEKSLALAETLYREGGGSLAGALEAAVARENILLALHRAEADLGQAVARLEQVTGASLSASAAPAFPDPVPGMEPR
ncbi:MAG: TolC family protein [Planctomycetaceae bacterium]|nr:TolC family protein [Planctomycetota bacterium]NUN52533.1 TolC family protein [Planctomycetaceae bacterium]